MLAGMLLDVITTAIGIHAPVNLSSRRQRFSRKMKNASIFFIGNVRNGNLFAIGKQHSKIMNLTATGGIKRCAVEYDGRPAAAVKNFNNLGVKVVEKRVVIVKSFSHIFLKSRAQRAATNTLERQSKLILNHYLS